MKKIVNWLAVCLLLVMGVTGCGFFKTIVEDPFIGNWIGLVKVPGMGKALLRVNIEPADNERYRVHATAENFQLKKEKGQPVREKHCCGSILNRQITKDTAFMLRLKISN